VCVLQLKKLPGWQYLEWERKIIFAIGVNIERRLETILQERKVVIRKIENLSEFNSISDRMHSLIYQAGFLRSKETLTRAKALINLPTMNYGQNTISIKARLYYNFIFIMYYAFRNDLLKSYVYSKQDIDLLESHPEFIINDLDKYISTLNNFHIICTSLKKYGESEEVILKLKAINETYGVSVPYNLRVKIFTLVYKLQMQLYSVTGQFERAIKMVEEINSGFKDYGDKIEDMSKARLLFYIVKVYFGAKKYRESLRIINTLLNKHYDKITGDVSACLHILSLLAHYELGNNNDFLTSQLKRTHRLLYEQKNLYRFEKTMLEFIKQLAHKGEFKPNTHSFKKLKSQLVALPGNSKSGQVADTFDFISWIESKIEKRSFAEILKEKSGL